MAKALWFWGLPATTRDRIMHPAEMSILKRIRHSSVGSAYRRLGHWIYTLRFRNADSVLYHLPRNVDIRLRPKGEVAEFLYYHRSFERTELALAAAYLKPGMDVIDVGANIGVYSILAARRVGPRGRVWAFEPSSETYQRLLSNLALNECSAVVPVKMALCDKDGESFVLRSDAGFGDAYRYLVPDTRRDDGAAVKVSQDVEAVAGTTLDCYAETNGIGVITFLKVDIEGGEYCFFQGARRVLTSSPDLLIMFESSPDWCARAGHDQRDVFALLRELGFGLYVWSGWRKKWHDSEATLMRAETVWACRDERRLPTP